MTFQALYGQNTADVALQTYGGMDSFVKMLVDNAISFDEIFDNTQINFTPTNNSDVNIFNNTTATGIIFSTGNSNDPSIGDSGDFNNDFNSDFNNQGS